MILQNTETNTTDRSTDRSMNLSINKPIERPKFVDIYNMKQANFFKEHNIKYVDYGFNRDKQKFYYTFERTPELEIVFQLWINNKQQFIKSNNQK